MLGGTGQIVIPQLHVPSLLQFVVSSLLFAFGVLVLLKNAASRYFSVDTTSEENESAPSSSSRMRTLSKTIEGGDGELKCFVCADEGRKLCSRCKIVRYCSPDCQLQHWKDGHKLECGKKASSSIALVPACRVQKALGQPKKILFSYDDFLKLYFWEKQVFPPCGLINYGNSCFANVVLQCLSFTRPLVAYLLEDAHSRTCGWNDWCFLCELQFHIQNVIQSKHPFLPKNILSRLPNISSYLEFGRQEDAHEFMRFAVDAMQLVYLDEFGGEKALHPSIQETSLFQRIFGGYLQSQVKCTKCNMVSNRYENIMDLTVEIQGEVGSLEDCLDQFTAKEWLDGENKYKCDGCNDYVKACKRLTIHQPPNILTIALKRYQSGMFGKLDKRVTFHEILNLGPYMSSVGDGDNLYALYAVVVHLDKLKASFFGHYICFIKDFNGNWYGIDDCEVVKVELENVLDQEAYMLLYSRLHVCQPKPLQLSYMNVPQPAQSTHVSANSEMSNPDTVILSDADVIDVDKPETCRFDKLSTHTDNDERSDMTVDETGTSRSDEAYQESREVVQDVSEGSSLQWKELDESICPSKMLDSCNKDKAMENQEPYQKSRENHMINLGKGYAVDTKLDAPIISTCSSSSVQGKSDENPTPSHRFVGTPCHVEGTKNLALESQIGLNHGGKKPLFARGFLDKPARKKSSCVVEQEGLCPRSVSPDN